MDAGIKRLLLAAHDPDELKALGGLTTEWGDIASQLAMNHRSEEEADDTMRSWLVDARDVPAHEEDCWRKD